MKILDWNIKLSIENLIYGFIFFLFFLEFNRDLRYRLVAVYFGLMLSTFVLILIFCHGKFKISFFVGWLLCFVSFLCISYLWTIDKEQTWITLRRTIPSYLFVLFLYQFCRKQKQIVTVLELMVLAGVCVAGLVILKNGSMLGLHYEGLTGDYNTNDLALMSSRLCFLSFLLWQLKKNKNYSYGIFIWTCLFLFFFVIISGSRRGLLSVISAFSFYYLLESHKKLLYRLLLVVLLIYFGMYVIMNNQYLYNAIGYRVQSVMKALNGTGTDEASFNTHLAFYQRGFSFFYQHPLIGYGIGGYAALNGLYYNWVVYSHNNYIELLVGCGLIGFFLYYYPYMKVLKNKSKMVGNPISYGLSVLVLSDLVVQVSSVSFSDLVMNVMIAFSFIFIERMEY